MGIRNRSREAVSGHMKSGHMKKDGYAAHV